MEITSGDTADINGRYMYNGAMDVLRPYIDSGKLQIKSGQIDYDATSTEAWATDKARGRAEYIAGKFYSGSTTLDAWLCLNDSTALGVALGLESAYTGKYPIITGQDCNIENVKNIINGKQAMSVFKDTRTLVERTVKMTTQIVEGKTVEVNDTQTYDNGVKVVPSYLCAPIVVTIDNYKTILIDSGYYTADQLGV
jgi:putative multiple sugar transport system substrate-binding protein